MGYPLSWDGVPPGQARIGGTPRQGTLHPGVGTPWPGQDGGTPRQGTPCPGMGYPPQG